MKLYGGFCWVLVRPDNGFPVQVYGVGSQDVAKHIADKNGLDVIECVEVQDAALETPSDGAARATD